METSALLDSHLLLFMACIALFTGFIKAGLPAVGALLSAVVALVFPPRDALGITLLYLLVGDTAAVSMFWRQADWQELKKMLLPVLLGIVIGGMLLTRMDNSNLGFTIGVLVLGLVALEPFRPQLTALALAHPGIARTASGTIAGTATTIGNAAGPILTIYFLVLKLDKRTFIGTGSIFFMFVNLAKLPVFMSQGMFHSQYFLSIALTAPLVYAGALVGRRFLEWIPQLWFNRIILFFTAVAGFWLVFTA